MSKKLEGESNRSPPPPVEIGLILLIVLDHVSSAFILYLKSLKLHRDYICCILAWFKWVNQYPFFSMLEANYIEALCETNMHITN